MINKSKIRTEINSIRNITISGRIGTGKSTLADNLAEKLNWDVMDGGKIFRRLANDLGISIVEKTKIPDQIDIEFEATVKKILETKNHQIIQSHLAGYVAQGISGVYKILVVCENKLGEDKSSIRIDRLMNRDLLSIDQAKNDVYKREEEHLIKFRRLYANNDSNWVYWDRRYYDLVVNTYSLNKIEATEFVIRNLKSL